MRILITALAATLAIATPSLADYVGDYEAAEVAGFTPVQWLFEYDATASMLDHGLVRPWLAENMPTREYDFAYATPDINGDGFADAIVAISSPHIRRVPLEGEGAITLVAYRMGQSLIVVGETMALDVGLRELPSGEQEVAYIDFEGIRGIGD